jgi:hypothetical protein
MRSDRPKYNAVMWIASAGSALATCGRLQGGNSAAPRQSGPRRGGRECAQRLRLRGPGMRVLRIAAQPPRLQPETDILEDVPHPNRKNASPRPAQARAACRTHHCTVCLSIATAWKKARPVPERGRSGPIRRDAGASRPKPWICKGCTHMSAPEMYAAQARRSAAPRPGVVCVANLPGELSKNAVNALKYVSQQIRRPSPRAAAPSVQVRRRLRRQPRCGKSCAGIGK